MGLGLEVGGGCAHLVSRDSFQKEKPDITHCEIFKVSEDFENEYRKQLLDKILVTKCKYIKG